MDSEEFTGLEEFVDIIRESAGIHGEFLNNSEVASALMEVAKNMENARKRLWMPDQELLEVAQEHEFDADVDAVNDAAYEQHDVA